MEYFEKILPNQKDNFKLIKSKTLMEKQIYDLVLKLSNHKENFIEHNEVSHAEMGSSLISQLFLSFIIKTNKVKKILEIGTFTGKTTTFFAKVNSNITIDTIEYYDSFANIAKKNFKSNKVADQINVMIGDAKLIIPKIKKKYDFIFIDGDKDNYLYYFQHAEKLLSKNGIIIIDDIFFHGDVFNQKPKSSKGLGVKKIINHLLKNKKKYETTIIPISNGIAAVKIM